MFLKRFKILIFYSLFTLLPFVLSAQYTINGKVVDNENRFPIESGTIVLRKNASIVNSTSTDSLGKFSFKDLAQGNYVIRVFRVGYFDTSLVIFISSDNTLEITIFKKNDTLQNIIVKGEKPYFERRGDRFSLNIAGNKFSTGTTAWDLLKITPLVIVTEQGGIGISGVSGARVYINERKLQLSGEALVSYLKSISSDNILRIEVIT